jgi:hypothetical protein
MPSRQTRLDYYCPHCKARNHAALWTRVDASTDPELAERILDGTLFEHACAACQVVSALDHAVQFVDPERKLACWLDPPGDPLAHEAAPEDELLEEFARYRVWDMNAFRELVHVWKDRLEEPAMLLLKHMLVARILQDTGSCPILCSFDALVKLDNGEWLEYIVFQTEESEPETLRVPWNVYASVRESVGPQAGQVFVPGRWVDWDDKTATRLWEAVQATGSQESDRT